MFITRPPGPSGIPFLGPVREWTQNPRGLLTDSARTHGDIAYFREGPFEVYLISDPALIEEVLVTRPKSFIKDDITLRLRWSLGDGLITSEGERWRRQRKLASPSFTRNQIALYGAQMVKRTEAHVETWESGEERSVHADMMAITLDIVTQTLFGGGRVEEVAEPIGRALEALMWAFHEDIHTWRRLLPLWVPTRGRRVLRSALDSVRVVIQGLIDAQRNNGGSEDTLLDRLLAARDDDGMGMTDEDLHSELLTLFVAGHETTALALTYSLILLARHEEAHVRLRQEVDAVLGNRSATVDDLPDLPFCHAVAKEAMRLYPPVWIIGRESIESIEMGGYTIPKGAQVIISQWVVHRDPRWFADPDSFRPERWLDPKERPRFAYFPFGGGPRVCIGNHFAMMEIVLVLATLMQRMRFSLIDADLDDLIPSVTLRPAKDPRVQVRYRAPTAISTG